MMQTKHAPRIVYLDRDSLPARIQIPVPKHPHDWVNHPSCAPEDIIEQCQNAEVVVTNKVPITHATLDACPSIRHIAVTATGYNIVDLDACRDRGVSVSNVPSYAAVTVAEHVIACAISLRRELVRYREQVISGAWQNSTMFCLFGKPIKSLRESTFGIIGFGEIGQATAKLAHTIGAKVIYTSRRPHSSTFARYVSFDELITQSDVVSVHCSLNKDTQDLISAPEIAEMQRSAILINTARGGIVNETDAVAAINTGIIGGLAFDVLEEEPPLADSPILTIADRSNVIITPHIAWASEGAMQHLANIVSANIDAFLAGTPQNIVSKP